ncbi:hypothetical protein [Methanoregula sp.]|uniref:hypothetical protein n=1 Tax=Methanoregula sp. TaxID=2052170 RepID=UPI003C77BBFE
MKDQIPAFSVCTAVLAMALLVAGCTSSFPVSTTPVTPVSPGVTLGQSSSSCGFTTCHGPDLACGTNVPQVCTQEYQTGDKCRLYAQCSSGSNGSCSLVTSPQFASCKACVENCAIKSGDDALAASDCEEKC